MTGRAGSTNKSKLVFVVMDGLADRPIAEFSGKTPLEAAYTPALDSLAAKGSGGMLRVIEGVAPESDAAVLAILGYDPYKYYTGRGPLEGVGTRARFKEGMLALRCNFATTADGQSLLDRRAGRTLTSKEAAALAAAINKKVKLTDANFKFYASVAHRGVLVISDGGSKLKTKKLSANITNTDPAYEIRSGIPHALSSFEKKVKRSVPLDNTAAAAKAAGLVNEFTEKAFDVMKNHPVNIRRSKKGLLPANTIICRDAGNRLPQLYSISKKYGRKWALLADMPLEIGIGELAGMSLVHLPLPTFTAADYKVRVERTIAALKRFDCLYIHIKGPDLFGHDGDYRGKKQCIEECDKLFFSQLLKKISLGNTVVVVTADHATPCEMKGHSADPVPFIISGGRVKSDFVERFGESYCRNGGFGTLNGSDFMGRVMTETFK
ncbi:2,3-bisphosphoglycerate-independent phosphoglycerate mutase [Candidatus Woesearchaeota archaeon]|nr:2,3-bisphosphoglycerate-independent phosphoglycerate mutase [Candidatus Woesearchaeota archaeon]